MLTIYLASLLFFQSTVALPHPPLGSTDLDIRITLYRILHMLSMDNMDYISDTNQETANRILYDSDSNGNLHPAPTPIGLLFKQYIQNDINFKSDIWKAISNINFNNISNSINPNLKSLIDQTTDTATYLKDISHFLQVPKTKHKILNSTNPTPTFFLGNLFDGLKGVGDLFRGDFHGAFQKLFGGISQINDHLSDVTDTIDDIKHGKIVDGIVSLLKAVLKALLATLPDFMNDAISSVKSVFAWIVTNYPTILKDFSSALIKILIHFDPEYYLTGAFLFFTTFLFCGYEMKTALYFSVFLLLTVLIVKH